MKRLLLATILVFHLSTVFGQETRQKTDSVALLLQQAFNAKNTEAIYDLTGESFRKAISVDAFKQISENNLYPLGSIQQAVYEKTGPGGVSKYKVVFPSVTLAMFLALDEKQKLSTFLFKEYVDETEKKKSPVASSNPMLSILDKKIDSFVSPYIQLSATAGLSIGVLKNGKMSFYGYGETSKGNKKLPDEKSIFEIGSISKTFTAILLADAVNDARVKLSDPIHQYIPEAAHLQFENTPITLQMLSNHSSGLPRMPDNFDNTTDWKNPYRSYDKQKLTSFLKGLTLKRKPGTAYEYSNLGVAVLGMILEKIYEKKFEQLVLEKIVAPLRISQTKQLLGSGDSLDFTSGYDENGLLTSHWEFDAFAPAGALRSTAADMLVYANAYIGGSARVLDRAIKLTMQPTFDKESVKTGLGWHFIKPGKDEIIFHNGGTGGYRSYLAVNRNKKFAVVILSNTAISTDSMGNTLMQWLENN